MIRKIWAVILEYARLYHNTRDGDDILDTHISPFADIFTGSDGIYLGRSIYLGYITRSCVPSCKYVALSSILTYMPISTTLPSVVNRLTFR
jgi:hypothetical protein